QALCAERVLAHSSSGSLSAGSVGGSAPGSRATISTSDSSTTGDGSGQSLDTGTTSVCEWAPQPWSMLTTRPSSGDHSLAHTPNWVRCEPLISIGSPQVE